MVKNVIKRLNKNVDRTLNIKEEIRPALYVPHQRVERTEENIEEKPKTEKNKKNKKDEEMVSEQIEKVESIVNNFDSAPVKVVKKDKGLIERTESSKIILTEDNRQVLND